MDRYSLSPDLGLGGRLTIDLSALATNYRHIAARTSPSRAAAVVKADAYGLGAERVAPMLAAMGCRDFFVAHLAEAIPLLPLLPPDARLFILNGLAPGTEQLCADAGAIPVLNAPDQAARWRALAAQRGVRLPAAVQVDSGMSRLGLTADEAAALAASPDFAAHVDPVLVMSHLACADTPDHGANAAQHRAFTALADRFPGVPRALANSGGAFLPSGFHGDLVRPGIALYGGAPFDGDNPMRAVVSLDARVIQTRTVAPGTGVGYGLSFTALSQTRLATIAVGYADGLPRALGNRGAAWFKGVRLPIAGRVSMDSISLDISALPEGALQPGDWVELIGPHQSLDRLAADAGTISYEILTSLGSRYERHYLDAAGAGLEAA